MRQEHQRMADEDTQDGLPQDWIKNGDPVGSFLLYFFVFWYCLVIRGISISFADLYYIYGIR